MSWMANLLDALTLLEKQLPRRLEETCVAGLCLVFIQEGQTVSKAAFGVADCSTNEPLTVDHLFEAASLSKPLFAWSVLQFVHNGRLDLDRPLCDLLTPVQTGAELVFDHYENSAWLRKITARHVLSHTTGMPNWSWQAPVKVFFEPGTVFSYSGEAFMFLQRVIATLSGISFESWWTEIALKPLNMLDSSVTFTGQANRPVARSHGRDGKTLEKRLWPDVMAPASLHTTLDDYARFLIALLDDQSPWYDITQEMLTPRIQVNDMVPWSAAWPKPTFQLYNGLTWGMGWGLEQTAHGDLFFQWGSQFGYKGLVLGSQCEKAALLILSNSEKLPLLWDEIASSVFGRNHPALNWLRLPA